MNKAVILFVLWAQLFLRPLGEIRILLYLKVFGMLLTHSQEVQ